MSHRDGKQNCRIALKHICTYTHTYHEQIDFIPGLMR